MPTVVFPPPEMLSSAHEAPQGEALARALAEHPRVWLVLHQRKPRDLDPALLASFRIVEEEEFKAISPEIDTVVVRCERK
jgi:hypothetical protein